MPGPSALDDYARKRQLRVVGGAESVQPPAPPGNGDAGDPASDCPITVLGRVGGTFYFLDIEGEERHLTGRQLTTRGDLMTLFLGDSAWLLRHFAKTATRKFAQNGQTVEEEIVVGFQTSIAGEFLMAMARSAGMFGPQVVLRDIGIWADEHGAPAVHCGDAVFRGGIWQRAGQRAHKQVWKLAAPTPRPNGIADVAVARDLIAGMRDLWSFRRESGELLALGLIGTAYLGSAASWRPNGFLTGSAGSGKTMLLALLRALTPLHHYTNDTSKAGIEQACTGRAMPIFVDEAGDRRDQRGAEALMDIVLASTGGEGTKGHRGSQAGQVRTIELLGSIIMASVNPPDMQPQHLSRITMIELGKAEAGADNRAPMEALIARARAVGPALWGRALAGFPRWQKARDAYRAALGGAGCAAREQDQYGALLAGAWVLVEDGIPDERQALDWVHAIGAYIRCADEVAEEDGPRRMLHYLLSSAVPLDRSTELEQIGVLLNRFFSPDVASAEQAKKVLARYGLRPVIGEEGHPDGIWFSNGARLLTELFAKSEFAGSRWKSEMRRLRTAHSSGKSINIGGVSAFCVWINRAEVQPPDG